MKKAIILLGCFLLCGLCTAKAENLLHRAGEWNIGVGLKTSTPGLGTDWGEFNVDDETAFISHDAKPGATSIGVDLQTLYFIKEYLAVGLAAGYEYFDHEVSSGWEMDVDTNVSNLLFLVRVFLNPSAKYKVYIPLAAGVGHIESKIDMNPTERFHYTGFSGHAGLGLERLFNERWSASAELRYNYNRFHQSKIGANGHKIMVYPELNYVSLSFRADRRF